MIHQWPWGWVSPISGTDDRMSRVLSSLVIEGGVVWEVWLAPGAGGKYLDWVGCSLGIVPQTRTLRFNEIEQHSICSFPFGLGHAPQVKGAEAASEGGLW